jgi:hypothetical protein
LNQEISAIQERIKIERELNNLRRNQQEDFGKLLIESPKKFRETVNDIQSATNFFKGVTDINVDGLQTIFKRIQRLRGTGDTNALQTVLRGIKSASQFGKEVVPGVGTSQLESVFSKLQMNFPSTVLKDIQEQAKEAQLQTDLQDRIEEKQAIQEKLVRLDIALQEAQLRIASTSANIARTQRDTLITSVANQTKVFVLGIKELLNAVTGEATGTGPGSVFLEDIKGLKLFGGLNEQTNKTKEAFVAFDEAIRSSTETLRGEISGDGAGDVPTVLGGSDIFKKISSLVGEGVASGRTSQIPDAGKLLRDKDVLQDTGKAFRELLQGKGGQDTDFVKFLREQDSSKRLDLETLRGALSRRGLEGVAGRVTSQGRGREVIDDILDLQEELSKNQSEISKAAGKEIKKILSSEIAAGVKNLNDAINAAKESAGKSFDREAVLAKELKDFSIVQPEMLEELRTSIAKPLNDSFDTMAERITGAFIEGAKNVTIKVDIPKTEHDVTLSVKNGITASEFASQLVLAFQETGVSSEEVDRLGRNISKVTEALVKVGFITRDAQE